MTSIHPEDRFPKTLVRFPLSTHKIKFSVLSFAVYAQSKRGYNGVNGWRNKNSCGEDER
jgi:hypothetical protein